MQRNQVKFATLDAGNDFRLRKIRLDFSLTNVAPPDQHVGPIEIFLGQPLFRIVEVAGTNLQARLLSEMLGNRLT